MLQLFWWPSDGCSNPGHPSVFDGEVLYQAVFFDPCWLANTLSILGGERSASRLASEPRTFFFYRCRSLKHQCLYQSDRGAFLTSVGPPSRPIEGECILLAFANANFSLRAKIVASNYLREWVFARFERSKSGTLSCCNEVSSTCNFSAPEYACVRAYSNYWILWHE